MIIFDCDGVILDSNEVKSEAFRSCLVHEDRKQVEAFITYHKKNQGISRFKKLKYFYEKIKKERGFDDKLKQNLAIFNNILKKNLYVTNFVEGVMDVLKFAKQNNIKCIVNSGGYEEELKELFKFKKINHYFDEILGSPNSKIENLLLLKEKKRILYPCVFFGDSQSDYIAAKKFDLEFIYVKKYSNWSGYKDELNVSDQIIDTFIDLK